MSENNLNVIKSITVHECPHCKKKMFVENHMVPAMVATLFTEEEAKQAKEDCKNKVEALSIDAIKKENVKTWLDDPNTIFAPQEVDAIITSLLKSEK